jgi:hypothetical protein
MINFKKSLTNDSIFRKITIRIITRPVKKGDDVPLIYWDCEKNKRDEEREMLWDCQSFWIRLGE